MRLALKSFLFAAPLAAVLLCAAGPDTTFGPDVDLTDAQLIAYGQQDFDRGEMTYKHVDLGRYHGAPVVADFPCADVCPDNTTRIIHYELDDGQKCSSVGGAERTLTVPTGIGKSQEKFCVPRVLAERGLARTPQ
jgi:hypothetical protein